jgi:hypothetical protein
MTSQDLEHHQLYSYLTMKRASLNQILSPSVVWGSPRKKETETRVTLERKVNLCSSQHPFAFSWSIRVYLLLLVIYFVGGSLVGIKRHMKFEEFCFLLNLNGDSEYSQNNIYFCEVVLGGPCTVLFSMCQYPHLAEYLGPSYGLRITG